MPDTSRQARAVFVLLAVAFAWSLLLVAASLWLPVYTLSTNRVGFQPRVSVWTEFGFAGLVPALAAVLVAIILFLLLRRGRAVRPRVVMGRAVGFVVLVAAFVSLAFLHLEGLLFLLFALPLIAASWIASPVPGPTKTLER